jgi:hypothetical protein
MPFKPVSPAPLQPHAGGDGGNGHESRCPPTGAPGAAPQASAAAEAPSRRPLCLVPGREPVGLFEFPSVQAGRGFCAYTPPCTISYDYDAPAGGSMVQQVRAPTRHPGRGRVSERRSVWGRGVGCQMRVSKGREAGQPRPDV